MKDKRIPLYKQVWCKIRYWQMLYDISDENLADILHVSTRTLSNYDKNTENVTLDKLDYFLDKMDLDISDLIIHDCTIDNNNNTNYNAFEHRIVYNGKTYYEINPCLGYKQDSYYISLDGEIYSKIKDKILHPTTNKDGYLYQGMRTINEENAKISVAKVMLTTFQGTPPEDMVDPTTEHINGQRNDNRIDNLIWLERKENSSTRKNTGKGEANPKVKLNEQQVREICELLVKGNLNMIEIAEKYNVGSGCINSIKRRQNWTYISDEYDF